MPDDTGGVDLTRRELLKRGALVAGAVWTVPTVQVLNMTAAHATGSRSRTTGPPNGSSNGIGGSSGGSSGQWGG